MLDRLWLSLVDSSQPPELAQRFRGDYNKELVSGYRSEYAIKSEGSVQQELALQRKLRKSIDSSNL